MTDTLERGPRSRKTLRTALLSLTFTAATTAAALTPALVHAAPPAQQKDQVAGYFRMRVGDFEVTALYDGYVDIPNQALKGVPEKDLQGLLARMFLQTTPGVQTAINGYLVHTGEHLVLVDTGTAGKFGPTTGTLLKNLRAAGYDPGQVDVVLLTHMHPDHACGLLTEDGKAAFPNAEVRAAQAEVDYWLNPENVSKVAADKQGMFQMALDAVAPYRAAGRFKPYAPGETLVSNIVATPANGHTPGHSAYLFKSREQSLLIWGDIVHSHATQFPRPEVVLEFDVDSKQAVATRKRLLADAAKNKLWVGGMHLPFPGLGHVRAESKGYAWVPAEYGPIRSDR